MIARDVKAERLSFTTNIARAVRTALVVFIAVGTPPKEDGKRGLQYVEQVAKEIARLMDGYKVIVTKSNAGRLGRAHGLTKSSKNIKRSRFRLMWFQIPEFLREGAAIEDFMRPNRVVIGASNSKPSRS